MVVDSVIRNWVTVVDRYKVRPEVFGQAAQCITHNFYADDGLLASYQPAFPQEALDVLLYFLPV